MRNTQIASRYARAIYSLAKDKGEQDTIFGQIRAVEEALTQDAGVREFIHSPLYRPSDKVKALEAALAGVTAAESMKNFVLLLAKKNRLSILPEIVKAYQQISDEAHGVTRGVVHSATVLGPEERARIAELVSRATKKQVILTYKEDPSLLGGLVAEVGSFTFDDSLISHLKRINEQLTRSAH